MFVVSGVPAAVVHVVDMIPMRDRDVTTPFAVPMVVRLVHRVAGWLTFVVVVLVLTMDMTVMHIVDMIPMRDRDVTTPLAMHVIVLRMLVMQCAGHRFLTTHTKVGFARRWCDRESQCSSVLAHVARHRTQFIYPLTGHKLTRQSGRPDADNRDAASTTSTGFVAPVVRGNSQMENGTLDARNDGTSA